MVEKAGVAMKKLLQRSDPFKSQVKEGIAQCVEKMEKDCVLDEA